MYDDPNNPFYRGTPGTPPPPPPPPPWAGPAPGPAYAPPPKSNAGLVIGLLVGGFVLLFLLISAGVGAYAYMQRAKAQPVAVAKPKVLDWSDAESPVPVTSEDPMRGERDALVTIVVFSDFQCPFCKRLETTLDTLRDRYGRDLRIVWKNNPLPFHADARPAAEAAQGVFELAGNEAFWRFHDKCFANQSSLRRSNFESWAKLEGIDGIKFSRGLTAHEWAEKIDEDMELAQDLVVRGTPVSFVNGIAVSGAQPVTKFEDIIDDELVKAREAVAWGTPRDRIYVERSRKNYKFAGAQPTGTAKELLPPEPQDKIYAIPVGSSPVRGPATALVTIVEFSDYQCPFCKRAEATMERLRDEYPSDVRIVFKQQPLAFHQRAEPAAELALEARAQRGDKAYWIAHDKLFASAPKLENDDLLAIARSMGLDEGRVSAAILTKKHKAIIDADQKLAAEVGATGTPTFFINGRKVTGAQPYERFKQVVDEEIPKAKALAASGTPRSVLYEKIVGLR